MQDSTTTTNFTARASQYLYPLTIDAVAVLIQTSVHSFTHYLFTPATYPLDMTSIHAQYMTSIYSLPSTYPLDIHPSKYMETRAQCMHNAPISIQPLLNYHHRLKMRARNRNWHTYGQACRDFPDASRQLPRPASLPHVIYSQ
jgi:hypothetical protein